MFEQFTASDQFRAAVAAAGLPWPRIEPVGEVHTTRVARTGPGDCVESGCEVAALDAIGQAELVRRGEVDRRSSWSSGPSSGSSS